MPKRDIPLKVGQAYWIRMPNKKGYSIYSAEVLKMCLENGTIKSDDLVQIRRTLIN